MKKEFIATLGRIINKDLVKKKVSEKGILNDFAAFKKRHNKK